MTSRKSILTAILQSLLWLLAGGALFLFLSIGWFFASSGETYTLEAPSDSSQRQILSYTGFHDIPEGLAVQHVELTPQFPSGAAVTIGFSVPFEQVDLVANDYYPVHLVEQKNDTAYYQMDIPNTTDSELIRLLRSQGKGNRTFVRILFQILSALLAAGILYMVVRSVRGALAKGKGTRQ